MRAQLRLPPLDLSWILLRVQLRLPALDLSWILLRVQLRLPPLDLCRTQSLSLASRLNSIHKLKAVVYSILPSTTAMTDYATGLEKLSANGEFFIGAEVAATQIMRLL